MLHDVKRQAGDTEEQKSFKQLLEHFSAGTIVEEDWRLLMTRTPRTAIDATHPK
jgi:hypothetical protein